MPNEVVLMAAGDVMMARTVGQEILNKGPLWPFRNVRQIFDRADITVVNLECTVGNIGIAEHKHYTFQAPPAVVACLPAAGIQIVSQANNHALDYGPSGFLQAQSLLIAQGIATVGAGRDRQAAHEPFIFEKKGIRFAVMAFVDVPVEAGGFDTKQWTATDSQPGVAWIERTVVAQAISTAKRLVDHVIVFFHFGFENQLKPNRAQQSQSREAISAGASLVIGAHPHVLQGTEIHGSGVIAYSLGNFVFDRQSTLDNTDSAVLELEFTKTSVKILNWHAAIITSDGTPRPATQGEADRIARRVAPIGDWRQR